MNLQAEIEKVNQNILKHKEFIESEKKYLKFLHKSLDLSFHEIIEEFLKALLGQSKMINITFKDKQYKVLIGDGRSAPSHEERFGKIAYIKTKIYLGDTWCNPVDEFFKKTLSAYNVERIEYIKE